MLDWQENKRKNGCQIVFDDNDGEICKSLYLDTLGAEARRLPSPVERHHKLHGTIPQRPSSCCEGYIHGALSTAGIYGASPTPLGIPKQKQHLLAETAASGATAAAALDLNPDADSSSSNNHAPTAAAVCRPNLLGQFDDPGMHPKVLIPPSTNRPDLIHSTADIDGAHPCPKDVCHRPRDTNPLSPQYRLATGSGIQFSSSPGVRQKLLRDTLVTADIPGAVPCPKTPAARAAAARAAAGCSSDRSSADGAGSSSGCSRAGVLEVGDIPGAFAAWRPSNRRHFGLSVRDTCLNVSDINAYMARFKPAPRSSAEYKGHPQGPRVPSPVRPRSHPSIADNSLRKCDIEGTSVRLAPRATHTTCLDVADIEGAHPGSRDRAQLFTACKAASEAASAQQKAAQAALTGLQLKQRELLQLWTECSRMDRDRSGYITGQELVQAMQRAQVQLAPSEAQHLAAALQNNLGLLNYKKLTRQLKGRVSRPASALAAHTTAPAAVSQAAPAFGGVEEANTVQQQQQQLQCKDSAAAQRWQRPQSALPGSRLSLNGSTNGLSAASGQAQECGNCGNSSAAVCGSKCGNSRPGSAPARPSIAGASGCGSGGAAAACSSREEYVCASTWRTSNREGVSAVPHWFCGSKRDAAVAGEAVHWRPGHAADAMTKGWGLNGPAPWDAAPAVVCCVGAAADEAAAAAAEGEGSGGEGERGCGDVVPAWMVGADALHGTCRISQPFGQTMQSAGEPAAAVVDVQHVANSRDGAVMQQAQAIGSGGQWKSRPASAGPCCRQPASPSSHQQHPQKQLPGQLLSWGQGSARGIQAGRQQLQRPRSAGLGGCSPTRASGGSKPQGLSALGHVELVIAGRSSSRVGLAERRRLVEGQKQDLLAVRMLA